MCELRSDVVSYPKTKHRLEQRLQVVFEAAVEQVHGRAEAVGQLGVADEPRPRARFLILHAVLGGPEDGARDTRRGQRHDPRGACPDDEDAGQPGGCRDALDELQDGRLRLRRKASGQLHRDFLAGQVDLDLGHDVVEFARC